MKRIAIAGSGSIGCFVGGILASRGHHVRFLGRARIGRDLQATGLRLTSFEGLDLRVPAGTFVFGEDPSVLADAEIVLVCVKSADTAAMAGLIATHAPSSAVIVSLQNGITNPDVLRAALPGHRVLAGMVPFNVVGLGNGHFHRATSGDIVIEADPAGTAGMLSSLDLVFRASDRITRVQWGKLLLNLNNALNALSGLPLREQLSDRSWRCLFADQISEALRVLKAAGIAPVSTTPLSAALIPRVLRLPDAMFRAIAGAMIRIDPKARSSMSDDLAQGRRTEIDYLQGAVVALATEKGTDAPLSRRIVELVKAAEGRQQVAHITPATIRIGVRSG